jgi:hypothetical protein
MVVRIWCLDDAMLGEVGRCIEHEMGMELRVRGGAFNPERLRKHEALEGRGTDPTKQGLHICSTDPFSSVQSVSQSVVQSVIQLVSLRIHCSASSLSLGFFWSLGPPIFFYRQQVPTSWERIES